ncbi:hypothetical protein RhiirC2_724805, partial [Rhizophagus irregularis]
MIKDIGEMQQIEDFLNLRRNEQFNNSEVLSLIDWHTTIRLLKKTSEITSFDDHNLTSFKVKLRAEELPTLDNL